MTDEPKIAKLVGDKCILQCVINNTNISIYMDTGLQVSIIEQEYLRKKFPSMTINPMEDLLDRKELLRSAATEFQMVGRD